jgi:hypothetical protein
MEVLVQAIDEAGEDFRSFPEGPFVKAVGDEVVRERYRARIAELPKDDDTPEKLAERQKKAFNRSIKALLDAKRIVAGKKDGGRVLWLP